MGKLNPKSAPEASHLPEQPAARVQSGIRNQSAGGLFQIQFLKVVCAEYGFSSYVLLSFQCKAVGHVLPQYKGAKKKQPRRAALNRDGVVEQGGYCNGISRKNACESEAGSVWV